MRIRCWSDTFLPTVGLQGSPEGGDSTGSHVSCSAIISFVSPRDISCETKGEATQNPKKAISFVSIQFSILFVLLFVIPSSPPDQEPGCRERQLEGHKVVTTIQLRLNWALVITASVSSPIPVQTVDVPIPASPPSGAAVVSGNFLGVSFELSAFDKYCEFSPDFYPVLRDSAYITNPHAGGNEVGPNGSDVMVWSIVPNVLEILSKRFVGYWRPIVTTASKMIIQTIEGHPGWRKTLFVSPTSRMAYLSSSGP